MASYGGLPATDTPRCSGKPGKLRGKSVGMVTRTDIDTTNGVLHVINGVLLPPSLKL